jgi:hypothetical protein
MGAALPSPDAHLAIKRYFVLRRGVGGNLRGAKPGDLPVQLPIKFEMVLNRKAAKALGLAVPPSILLRATEVIE